MQKINKINLFGVMVGCIILAGCAGTTPNLGSIGKSNNYESRVKIGNYKKAVKELKRNQKDDLLWYMDAGLISKYAKDHNATIAFFDKSEEKIKQYDKEVLAGTVLANIGAVITNDTFMDYRPKIYEGIMVNTYKGIDFLKNGDKVNARIEFNRALERQRRAKEFFAKEISQEQEKIKKEEIHQAKKNKINPNKLKEVARNKNTKSIIEKNYSNLFAFKAYPDFVNPFSSYMSGLFFLSVGDYAKASDILKETYGMIKDNEEASDYVKKDLEYALKASSSINVKASKHYAWVIFANGEGPSKEELRFDIPLFSVTKKVHYAGITLPTFKEKSVAFSNLIVKNGKNRVHTKQIASMDKIIKAEFQKRFPTIMTRAIIRTTTQTLMQYELQKKGGLLGGIIGAVYQGFMNRTDTRQWKNLPKNFQIARIPMTNPLLSINFSKSQKHLEFNLDVNKNHIIFVRVANINAKEIVDEISF